MCLDNNILFKNKNIQADKQRVLLLEEKLKKHQTDLLVLEELQSDQDIKSVQEKAQLIKEQKNSIELILSKKYIKPSDTIFHNSYRPYKEILLKKEKSIWKEETSNINPYWPWNTPNQ